ncbi:hypothetical protein [Stappia sp. ES.058]|uniref:hypothetical protein n=1 Tax=Stappia sp. ES.058 TaxID=1881061 RepID=UPI000879A292|nr:hypothetical protein [Stappia sp. ES.058]SDU08194.1 hypothetical protein SAMN05428979_1518 [Stappia sp. ES.058]
MGLRLKMAGTFEKHPHDYDVCSTPPMATIRVGPHVFKLERDRFEQWEKELAAEVGFAREDMVAEVKRRLGL